MCRSASRKYWFIDKAETLAGNSHLHAHVSIKFPLTYVQQLVVIGKYLYLSIITALLRFKHNYQLDSNLSMSSPSWPVTTLSSLVES
jgi:hypothetical protein